MNKKYEQQLNEKNKSNNQPAGWNDKMFKNKVELSEYYIKNKMKLPPILQSKHFLLTNLFN